MSVAVVVPTYKVGLYPDERISYEHLTYYLDGYDKFAVTPHGLDIDWPGFDLISFDERFFTSVNAYSKLLLSKDFYGAFAQYEYILIYQLDCLVFSDDLESWCWKGYDYIGAPWFRDPLNPTKGFSRIGNGGFSLRKVESSINVLRSKRYLDEPVPYLNDLITSRVVDISELPITQRVVKKLRILRDVRRGAEWYASQYTLNEDHFWSDRANLFFPNFSIPPVDIALEFSFERFPRYCYQQNRMRMPLGCHAWSKWDKAFWKSKSVLLPK
jgi:hypothetical protein